MIFTAGILFTNTPTTVEQYNSTISTARALGGIGAIHDHSTHDHDHSAHDHDHSTHDQDHSAHDHDDHDYPARPSEKDMKDSQNDQELSVPLDDSTDSSMYGEFGCMIFFYSASCRLRLNLISLDLTS